MLNTEIKAQWLAALRSGNYKQTKGVLVREVTRGNSSYCCLGVLHVVCDIKRQDPADAELLDYDAASTIGLGRGIQNTLASMNDNGQSFAEIADYIEANL